MEIKTDKMEFTIMVLFKDGVKSIVPCSLTFESGDIAVPYFRSTILN